MNEEKQCVFCDIIAGRAPATYLAWTDDYISIVPKHPRAPGHALFIPKLHLKDATTWPEKTGMLMAAASRYAGKLGGGSNIITSVGREATQTVFHLHIHVVPRGMRDGLPRGWPWKTKYLYPEDWQQCEECGRPINQHKLDCSKRRTRWTNG